MTHCIYTTQYVIVIKTISLGRGAISMQIINVYECDSVINSMSRKIERSIQRDKPKLNRMLKPSTHEIIHYITQIENSHCFM